MKRESILMETTMQRFAKEVGTYMKEADKDPNGISNRMAYEIIGMMMNGYDKMEILQMFNNVIDKWIESVKADFIKGLKRDNTLLEALTVNNKPEQSDEEKLKEIETVDPLVFVKTMMELVVEMEDKNEDNQAKESN